MEEKWCSIIVPVYNVYNYLEQCVMSIVTQEESKIELILVDDGSKDESGLLCDVLALKYSDIKVIHKQNGGLSDARNAGIKEAEGQYILFVDGDDYIANNSLAAIHKAISENSYPDIVCLECVKFYSDSDVLIPMNDGIDRNINYLSGDRLYEYLANLPKYPASACTKAIKRDFLLKHSLFFKKGLLSEDLEWAMRLFSKVNKATYCPVTYYMYRQTRIGSISNSVTERNVLDLLSIFVMGADIAKNNIQLSNKKMICSFTEYVFRLIVLHYGAVSKDNQNKVKATLHKEKWILGSRMDISSRLVVLSYKLIGIRATSFLLKKYLKIIS